MTFNISQSKINCWRTCHNQYHYKYILYLQRKHKNYPFMRGTIVHDMLEQHYLKRDPWKPYNQAMKEYSKLFRVEREEYGDLPNDLKALMEGYFAFYKKEDLKPIDVEREFKVRLVNNIFMKGKIDLVAKSQGLKWITEHKVHNQIPNGSTVPYTNLQASIYTWAYREATGKTVDGVLWNYMLGKAPSKPQVLKNGTMSKRHTATTWPIYRQAVKDAGLDVRDYLDVKKKLKDNELNFYQRKFLPIDERMTKNILEDTKITALEIQKNAGKDRTKNLGRHCDYCEFKNLCLSELKGLDTKHIIKADFKKQEKKK